MSVGSYAAVRSFWFAQKRLIKPTTMGISPMSVQTKSDEEPDAAWAAATTIQTPKAIIPAEIKNESASSMIGPLQIAHI